MGHDDGRDWDRSYKEWQEGIVRVKKELIPKEVAHEKDVPTIIEYKGRRYVLESE